MRVLANRCPVRIFQKFSKVHFSLKILPVKGIKKHGNNFLSSRAKQQK